MADMNPPAWTTRRVAYLLIVVVIIVFVVVTILCKQIVPCPIVDCSKCPPTYRTPEPGPIIDISTGTDNRLQYKLGGTALGSDNDVTLPPAFFYKSSAFRLLDSGSHMMASVSWLRADFTDTNAWVKAQRSPDGFITWTCKDANGQMPTLTKGPLNDMTIPACMTGIAVNKILSDPPLKGDWAYVDTIMPAP